MAFALSPNAIEQFWLGKDSENSGFTPPRLKNFGKKWDAWIASRSLLPELLFYVGSGHKKFITCVRFVAGGARVSRFPFGSVDKLFEGFSLWCGIRNPCSTRFDG